MTQLAALPLGVIFWDVLALVLVVFPLLTGGIWIERPHLFIELSDLGVSVLIVAALAAILKGVLRVPLERSRVVAFTLRLWRGWRDWLAARPGAALGGGFSWVALIWGWSSLAKHAALDSHAFDLGIFTNAIWNLTHGNGYYSAVKGGIPLFADHQSPLFWALAPVFALAPAPETLLVLQAAGLALGAFPLYWLGRQYLEDRDWLAALPVLYWAYLPLRNANAFDFHPEVFMLPLFLAAIAGLQGRSMASRGLGALAFLLALGAKESAGPVAAGIGLAWMLGAGPARSRRFTRGLGAAVALAGVAEFYFDLKVVPARFFAGQYAYGGLYDQYGKSAGEILSFPFREPGRFLSQLFDHDRRKFLFWTLAPLGFVPLGGWPALVAALPGYLMLFLSAGNHRVNLTYHYAIEPAVGLFWALPLGMRRLVAAVRPRRRTVWAALWMVFFGLGAFGRSDFFRIRRSVPSDHARWVKAEVLPAVDPALPIAATEVLVPHLSTRRWVHGLDSIHTPDGLVACVIRDLDLSNWPMGTAEMQALSFELAVGGYQELFHCGQLSVFARGGAACLTRQPACP